MEIQIEKGIEQPREGRGSESKYPFKDMEVGDSFFMEGGQYDRHKVSSAARSYGERSGKKFISRSIEGGFRIWRTL